MTLIQQSAIRISLTYSGISPRKVSTLSQATCENYIRLQKKMRMPSRVMKIAKQTQSLYFIRWYMATEWRLSSRTKATKRGMNARNTTPQAADITPLLTLSNVSCHCYLVPTAYMISHASKISRITVSQNRVSQARRLCLVNSSSIILSLPEFYYGYSYYCYYCGCYNCFCSFSSSVTRLPLFTIDDRGSVV